MTLLCGYFFLTLKIRLLIKPDLWLCVDPHCHAKCLFVKQMGKKTVTNSVKPPHYHKAFNVYNLPLNLQVFVFKTNEKTPQSITVYNQSTSTKLGRIDTCSQEETISSNTLCVSFTQNGPIFHAYIHLHFRTLKLLFKSFYEFF